MAAKFYAVFALYFVSKVSSAPMMESVKNDICACESMTEMELEKQWEFLKETEVKQQEFPIPPGMLSPAVPCSNCIEYNRKKRRTDDSEVNIVAPKAPGAIGAEDSASDEDEDFIFNAYRNQIEQEQTNKSCPIGFSRQGKYCVPFGELL